MVSRLSAFLIWALVAASAVFWGLRYLARAPEAPAFTVAVAEGGAVRGDLTRLLGAPPVAIAAAVPAAPAAASRFKLIGLMAPKRPVAAGTPSNGLALIAVDGKEARAFVVGARLDDNLVLQSVSQRSASIGPAQGAASVTLDLPPLPPPATGSLPAPGMAGARGAAPSFTPQVMPQVPALTPVPRGDVAPTE